MDIEALQWPEYETAFRALADQALLWEASNKPALDQASAYLCLYGDNGLDPAEELALLEQLTHSTDAGTLYRLEVDVDYWQDTILFRWP
jgi:hypothetical protein